MDNEALGFLLENASQDMEKIVSESYGRETVSVLVPVWFRLASHWFRFVSCICRQKMDMRDIVATSERISVRSESRAASSNTRTLPFEPALEQSALLSASLWTT